MMPIVERMREALRRLVRRLAPTATGLPAREDAQLLKWLEAHDAGRLDPPRDVHDPEAWDRYWIAQVDAGPMEQAFGDMMASDPDLLPALGRRGVRTVLCAGNGLSFECWTLAMHGFDVTVLDLSSIPRTAHCAQIANPAHSIHGAPGFIVRGEDAVAFEPDARIRPDDCPQMHATAAYPPRGGGSLTHVTGDLMQSALCPGPFDVVIERRAVQLFPPHEQPAALDRLAERLSPNGLLISHQHSGCWRPQEPRTHFGEGWATARGLTMSESLATGAEGRSVHFIFTSG